MLAEKKARRSGRSEARGWRQRRLAGWAGTSREACKRMEGKPWGRLGHWLPGKKAATRRTGWAELRLQLVDRVMMMMGGGVAGWRLCSNPEAPTNPADGAMLARCSSPPRPRERRRGWAGGSLKAVGAAAF